ncbi:MAG: S9 family peptidase [Xanthobacteraceae bacterium]
MRLVRIIALIIGLACLSAWAGGAVSDARAQEAAVADQAAPPVARIVPKHLVEHGRTRDDPYDWLRASEDPQVINYLEAENAYADRRLASIRPLTDEIAAELRAREAQEDTSVPYHENGYLYEQRFTDGAQFPVILRRKDVPGAPEEVVLDIPALAAGHPYYRLNRWTVSPDGARVAFAVDFSGGRLHRLFVREIATGEVHDEGISDAAATLAFAADSRTLFYVRCEPKTVRSHEVWRHHIGADKADDVRVYAEQDPRFEVFVFLSKSRRYIMVNSDGENSSEMRYLRADNPQGEFALIEPRRKDVQYFADHVGDRFFISTNLDAPDYRLMTAPQASPGASHWTELVPHRPGHYLRRFEAFEGFVAIDVEHEGTVTVHVLRLSDGRETMVPVPPGVGAATTNFFYRGFGGNRDASSHVLRLRFSAPLHPESTYDFDMVTGVLTLRKDDQAARWFQPEKYESLRISATAPDGESVPITLVYRKDMRRPGGNPALLYGYGAYGVSSRPVFSNFRFSLIDRGFVYAIAHVRGGRERGERWYEQGHGLNKRNSFTDFIAAAEALVARGFADRRAVFAQGGSAGGLLVAVAANERPDLFAGIVAEVPFVDVLTTTSDPSIPLTTLEYEEWGDPAAREHYDNIRSYSPYDNIERKAYPAMFVTAGLHDTQVSYAEPAKWVARLRATRTGDSELIFKTNMGAGHSGRPGRLGTVDETAEITAWLISQAKRAQQ